MGGRSDWRGPHRGPSGFTYRRRGEGSRGEPPSGSHDGEHEPAPASSRPHAGRQRREWPPSEPKRYPNVLPAANSIASPPCLEGPGGQSGAGPSSLPAGRRQRAWGSGQQRPRPSSEPQHLRFPENRLQECTDEFRMYTFKVQPCNRAYGHPWTECSFAHPGETARRRDPRTSGYSCTLCPEFGKGCPRGNSCNFAHGQFEQLLHPARYRTSICKHGTGCSRRVCFFAHTPEELRTVCKRTDSAVASPQSKVEKPMLILQPRHPSLASAAVAPSVGGINHNSLGLAPPNVFMLSPLCPHLGALAQQQQQRQLRSLGSHDLGPGIGVPSADGLPVTVKSPLSNVGSTSGKVDWSFTSEEPDRFGGRLPSLGLRSGGLERDVSWVLPLASTPDTEENLAADDEMGRHAAAISDWLEQGQAQLDEQLERFGAK